MPRPLARERVAARARRDWALVLQEELDYESYRHQEAYAVFLGRTVGLRWRNACVPLLDPSSVEARMLRHKEVNEVAQNSCRRRARRARIEAAKLWRRR